MLEESTTPIVEAHDLVMFDLDGVVYVGGEAIEGVKQRDGKAFFATANQLRVDRN